MGYSLAITAYRQTCNRSHRAKDNEHRRISVIRGADRGFTPENPLFTLTVDAGTAKKYYKRLGIKFFPTRYQPLTMVVYIT